MLWEDRTDWGSIHRRAHGAVIDMRARPVVGERGMLRCVGFDEDATPAQFPFEEECVRICDDCASKHSGQVQRASLFRAARTGDAIACPKLDEEATAAAQLHLLQDKFILSRL